MAIRLMPDGTYEFDTVTEALEFRQIASAGQDHSVKPADSEVSANMAAFATHIEGKREKVVMALHEHGKLTTSDLADKAGLEAGQIGGVIRHFKNAVETQGLKATDVIITKKNPREVGDPVVTVYELTPAFCVVISKEKKRRKQEDATVDQ